MDRRTKKRQPKEKPVIPCQYACGRPAAGTLLINFNTFASDPLAYQRGFGVTIPTCHECLRAAIKVAICIPEVTAGGEVSDEHKVVGLPPVKTRGTRP